MFDMISSVYYYFNLLPRKEKERLRELEAQLSDYRKKQVDALLVFILCIFILIGIICFTFYD